ncbi:MULTISPECIES: VOC family protein [Paenibacillus]|uniref:VOC domain-containing protein n=1 Tax=Paenibacillus albilobatus TaxID=2716884 RepID=A0A919XPI2_9BACL|nr:MULTISPECIES: VOC family protein [Paenibacillus]GIO34545.1 hypothetical protein J2TS6_56860 [Paenibacillus albilobatus]
MGIQQIGSVFIPVSRLERSIAFYSEGLGLTCRGIEDWGGGKRGATLFFNPHPEHAALLTLAETDEPIAASTRNLFNFKCVDARGLHAMMQTQGYRVSELETWDSPWNKHVMFDVVDPDGRMLNLIEMIPIEVFK